MEYRVLVVICNDDQEPSPESVLHLVGYLLREHGYVTAMVTMEDSHDDVLRNHLHDGEAAIG